MMIHTNPTELMMGLKKAAEEVSNEYLQAKGYFLITSSAPLKMGYIATTIGSLEGHPVVVIGEATQEEFEQQQRGYISKGYSLELVLTKGDLFNHFYKVTAE